MINKSTLRVGVVNWRMQGLPPASATASDLGYEVVDFFSDERLPESLDIVLAHGPLGSLVPLAEQLLACPSAQRPIVALWMTEPLPNPALPEWMRYTVSAIRRRAERLALRKNAQGEWQIDSRLQWLTRRLWRFRNYGELYWLYRHGVIDVLAISSQWFADFLRKRGFDPVVAYMGFRPEWAANLELERDIPVLWIGWPGGSSHRQRLLKQIRAELKSRGIEIMVVDGVENPYALGEDRTILMNRTKVVLNILKEKWDNNGMRFYLSIPNRALVVTEPLLAHTPLIPDVHFVEAPVDQMADKICYYLTHDEERQRIVERAYQFVTTELTMEKGIGQILEKATALCKKTIES